MRRDSRIAGEAPCPRKSKPGIAIHLALGRSTETPGGSAGGMRRQLDPNGVMRHRVRNQMLVAHAQMLVAHAAPGGRWSGRRDSNSRPPEPHSGALPGCATPRWQESSSGARLGMAWLAGGQGVLRRPCRLRMGFRSRVFRAQSAAQPSMAAPDGERRPQGLHHFPEV